ncbi:hypothetical protein J2W24_003039 [Variovorax boronicumulans]|uniref:TA system antitoxin ParD family protein n=1 Tax=Variovorax boronicumulans TaxID=436515 RepID=UPI002780FA2A|nr:hypothetical protein [Variovorax boronicumulans]MDP9917388.1 hypothetical protein [Variovorax boronicumulans]
MAQSIRVSNELYSLAQATGKALQRPIAQQMEHWARLGAALEAAGISSTAAMRLLGAKSTADELVALALGRSKISGTEQLRKLQADDADQVARGKRSAKSLHIVNKEVLQGFTFKRKDRAESAEGDGW